MIYDKYLFYLILSIGIYSCSFSDESSPIIITDQGKIVLEDSLQLIPRLGLVYSHGEPFTGTSISYYNNGKPASHIDYINGLKDGLYQKWFESGMLSFESEYNSGRINGVTKSWWKNGQIRSESKFINGIAEGVQKQWYKSGAIFKLSNLVDGKEDGMQQSWRENGKLYNNYEAKNGRIFGLKRASLCFELDNEIVQYEK